MRFVCRYENRETGDLLDQICTLDPDEIETVDRVRATEGDEIARVTAAAIVLKSAYRDLDAREWRHLSAPEPITLN